MRLLVASIALSLSVSAAAQQVSRIDGSVAGLAALPQHVVGRTTVRGGALIRQWPGTYFETALTGSAAFFRLAPGEVSLRISVDGGEPVALVKPAPGLYRVSGLGAGVHRLRIDVASESQASPTGFGGFFAPKGIAVAPLTPRTHQIEFIGDSHTVGYANTSTTRQCTEDEIWATTDTSLGIGPRVARRYDADYEINAISGRGMVRNYNGFAADTLPVVYPYTLFDKAERNADSDWRPQVIVIALGTNDFSTPLNAGEKWTTRAALDADYEATYTRFLQRLRARDPKAFIVLWGIDSGTGETQTEERKVVDLMRRAGDERIGFVPVSGLALSACNYHPNVADDQKIADAITGYIDAHPQAWQ